MDNVDYIIKVKKNTVVNCSVLFLMLGRRLIMAGKIFYRAEALAYMPILRTNHVVQGFIPDNSWTQGIEQIK